MLQSFENMQPLWFAKSSLQDEKSIFGRRARLSIKWKTFSQIFESKIKKKDLDDAIIHLAEVFSPDNCSIVDSYKIQLLVNQDKCQKMSTFQGRPLYRFSAGAG